MNFKNISDESKNFAHNVAWIRKHYGLSKKKMAQIMKIGIGSLNKIENGIIPPRLTVMPIIHIYNHFGFLPSVLMTSRLGEREKTAP